MNDDSNTTGSITQDNSNSPSDTGMQNDQIPGTWIKIVDGQFTCQECENTSVPETNAIEGVIQADLNAIKADLEQYPTKVTYGICPVCGMEYVFRLNSDDLYLEPSDLEK